MKTILTRYGINIHPLYFIVALFYIAAGKVLIFVGFFIALMLHEWAHQRAALKRGYQLNKIILMPYGAKLSSVDPLPKHVALPVAAAGIAMNCAVIVILLGLWWLFPVTYSYTVGFMYANAGLALINALPAYPLDGSRIILALCNNARTALKTLKISGLIVGIALISIGLASAFYTFNLSIIIFGIFITFASFTNSGNEVYMHIASEIPFLKNFANGVRHITVEIDSSARLIKVLRYIKSDTILTLVVRTEDNGKLTLTEREISDLMSKYSLKSKLSETIKGQRH